MICANITPHDRSHLAYLAQVLAVNCEHKYAQNARLVNYALRMQHDISAEWLTEQCLALACGPATWPKDQRAARAVGMAAREVQSLHRKIVAGGTYEIEVADAV